jgi:hypothetical protein
MRAGASPAGISPSAAAALITGSRSAASPRRSSTASLSIVLGWRFGLADRADRLPGKRRAQLRCCDDLLHVVDLVAQVGVLEQAGHAPAALALLRWAPRWRLRQTDRVSGSTSGSSAPVGYRFPREVIAVAVRWYLRTLSQPSWNLNGMKPA